MPIALIIIGLLMVVTGVKNTYSEFGAQLKSDFTGPGNFTYWIAAITIIGAVGYIKPLQAFANGFLVLVLLSFILKNGGVFDKLKSALQTGATSTPAQAPPSVPSGQASPGTKTSSSDASNVIGFAAQVAPLVLL